MPCLKGGRSYVWQVNRRKSLEDLRLDMPFVLQVEKQFDGSAVTAMSRQVWYASYLAAVLYLAFIFMGKELMKHRQPWELKGLLALWNLFLAEPWREHLRP